MNGGLGWTGVGRGVGDCANESEGWKVEYRIGRIAIKTKILRNMSILYQGVS